MKPSDDTRIREMLQRLKSADQQRVPGFEEILNRSAPTVPRPMFAAWAVVGCVTLLLVSAVFFIRWPSNVPTIATDPIRNEDHQIDHSVQTRVPDVPISEIDFDHFRQVVNDHCRASENTDFSLLPLWTSRTESLLALSSTVSQTEE